MSKRSERREAERLARKLAHQATRAAQTTPISDAQLLANQANAKLSTGPVTPEGKAISARNNTRHGLAVEPDTENFRVLPNEDQAAYDRDLAGFRKEWQPVTATEHDLVNRLATHQWLRRRALCLQQTAFDPYTGELTDAKKFDLFRRYEAQHERGFNKAMADIMRLRAFQVRQQNGFESQCRKSEEHEFKIRRLQQQEQLRKATLEAKTAALQAKLCKPPLEMAA